MSNLPLMYSSERDFSDVILTGGTGRSGTTIIGKLLSRHSQIGLSCPAEIKMHVAGNGLLDLYLGNKVGRYKSLMVTKGLHLKRFHYRLFNDWWERDSKLGEVTGLVQGIELNELQGLFYDLKTLWKKDQKSAARKFMRAFIDSQKLRSGKYFWIETTPINLFRATEMAEFLPGTRFIHMVRDGRDVIASVLRENWGPKTYEEGLIWYRRRMRRILINTKSLGDEVLTLCLEDLTLSKREESLSKLFYFLNLKSEAKLVDYFNSEVKAEKVNKGRWQNEVRNIERFNQEYFRIVEELKGIDSSVPLSSR